MSYIRDPAIRAPLSIAIAPDGSFGLVVNYYDNNKLVRITLVQKKRPKNARKFAAAKGKKKKKKMHGGAKKKEEATVGEASDAAGGGGGGDGSASIGIRLAADLAKVKLDEKATAGGAVAETDNEE